MPVLLTALPGQLWKPFIRSQALCKCEVVFLMMIDQKKRDPCEGGSATESSQQIQDPMIAQPQGQEDQEAVCPPGQVADTKAW